MKRKFKVKVDRFKKVKACPGCRLMKHRRRQVIGKGSIPATLLFIGEGPGKTEDLTGEPFTGISGNLLDRMIEDACDLAECDPPSYYITNTVLCRAWIWDEENEDFGKDREPKRSEVLACKKNVLEIARIVKPKMVVFVGQVAKMYYSGEFPVHAKITHPAAHMRFGGFTCGQASPYYQTDIRTLADLFEEYANE